MSETGFVPRTTTRCFRPARPSPTSPSPSYTPPPDGHTLGSAPAAEVPHSEATGFLKNVGVWGACRPPGSVGGPVHVLFVGRRPSTFLHPKGACDPKPVSVAFLNGPCPPTPTALSGGLAAIPPQGGPALVFLSPAALEVASPHSENPVGHQTPRGLWTRSATSPPLALPARTDQAHSGGVRDPREHIGQTVRLCPLSRPHA